MQLEVTVHILCPNGIGGGDNETHYKSLEQAEKMNEEKSAYDEDDDKILKDRILIKILAKDKKNFQNNINFSLIKQIGSSIFYKKLIAYYSCFINQFKR